MIRSHLAVNTVVLALLVSVIWGSVLVLSELDQQRDDDAAAPEDRNDVYW